MQQKKSVISILCLSLLLFSETSFAKEKTTMVCVGMDPSGGKIIRLLKEKSGNELIINGEVWKIKSYKKELILTDPYICEFGDYRFWGFSYGDGDKVNPFMAQFNSVTGAQLSAFIPLSCHFEY